MNVVVSICIWLPFLPRHILIRASKHSENVAKVGAISLESQNEY